MIGTFRGKKIGRSGDGATVMPDTAALKFNDFEDSSLKHKSVYDEKHILCLFIWA